MPKKKEPSKDEKPQSQRFVDAAKEAEADESGEEFERAFRKIVKRKENGD
ncbi:hypothetical protein [Henriciella barbarensis]|nr:hypothetical protein [Henriciella barbarensis]